MLLTFRSWWWVVGLLILGGLACHHPRRNNPFDPALTPAVTMLAVRNDTTTGAVTLTWTPYAGDQPFASYNVLRQEVDRITVETLATIPDVSQTTYVDTTRKPNTEYLYRVAVVNTRGFANPSEVVRVPGYPAGPVEFVSVTVNPERGEVMLRWNRFQGGRFEAYRLERRAVPENPDFTIYRRIDGVEDTVFVDENLRPDVVYGYQVVVEAGGQVWRSSRGSGTVSFSLLPVRLLEAQPDSLKGTVVLRWEQYRGLGFEQYEVRRRRFREEVTVLERIPDLAETTWTDTGALPGTGYLYSVAVLAAGQELVGESIEAVYDLPSVTLQRAAFSSQTATAELVWTPYRGPRFAAYEVRRQVVREAEQTVAELIDVGSTTYIDTLLDGNTEYTYRIFVRTTWESDVGVFSNVQRGTLYL